MNQQLPQPWDEDHHGNNWHDRNYINAFLTQHWNWLPETYLCNPPELPITYGHVTFKPGYFPKLLRRWHDLETLSGKVRLAEERNLAYELWLWRQISKQRSRRCRNQ